MSTTDSLLLNGDTPAETQHDRADLEFETQPSSRSILTRTQIIAVVIGILAVIAIIAGVSAYILTSVTNEETECVMGSVEDCSTKCDYAAIFNKVPTFDQLTVNNQLFPNPYVSLDGSMIDSKSKWPCRRAEISAQLQTYELGIKPDKTETPSLTTFMNNSVLITTITLNNVTISFNSPIKMPTNYNPTARVPAIILLYSSNTLNQTTLDEYGIATIRFPVDTIAQQNGQSSRGVGLFYNLFGKNHSASALMAWSWGVSRLIDALEMTSADHMIDISSLGVTGCSRWGKGALVVGAFDERIALTIPQESGAGGSASWRLSDITYTDAYPTQRLRQIVDENVWFRTSFRQFSYNVSLLPYDHHVLEAMVAPRGLLVLDNTDQIWLGNFSSYGNSVIGQSIYADLGVGPNMGVSQRGGFSHCSWSPKQQQPFEAFLKKFLLHQQDVNTNVSITDGSYNLNVSTFVDWKAPW